MRKQGFKGLARAQNPNTIPDPARPCPQDKVNHKFKGGRPQSVPGRRLHLCANRNGSGLHRFRPRRPQPGHLPTTSGAGRFDPPLGLRHALSVHPIRRAARRSRNRHVGRKGRGQLRQRIGRNRHRIVQDVSRQTPRPVENQWPTRMGDHEMDALMQQGQAARAIGYQTPNERENVFRQQNNELEKTV